MLQSCAVFCTLVLLCIVLPTWNVSAREETETAAFEFIDRDYGDIFYALSSWTGIPIIADTTVTGRASFRFSGASFEEAFSSFLESHHLYSEINGNIITISRIKISDAGTNENEKIWNIDAYDVTPAVILEYISRKCGKTILFDILPVSKISVHIADTSVYEGASLVMKPFDTFSVSETDGRIIVRQDRDMRSQEINLNRERRLYIARSGELYSADIQQARISEALALLCEKEGSGYSSFLRNDPVISNLKADNVPFETLLLLLLAQANAETELNGSIRCFYPLPGDIASTKLRDTEKKWTAIPLVDMRANEVAPFVSSRFPDTQIHASMDTSSILLLANEETTNTIEAYIRFIDRKEKTEPISLSYISTENFLKNLPPHIRREDICDTGTGSSFYYTGPAGLREYLVECLKELDRPKKRIRYDMLIIQYENSSNLEWNSSAELRQLAPGDTTAIAGNFGSLLSLNLDVITLFGYQFSARLDSAISENRAQVFADTTLHGISGENIKFQNTSTYRYRDSNIDPETGKPIYTGITREIISGIMLDINGWVSGDGMVTMEIHASVSKRGADVSNVTANPPTTSEKSVTTHISTQNGEPVILSGLVQDSDSFAEKRMPFLSRIPLAGWLFRNAVKTHEKTEMVIYLIPHITNDPDEEFNSDERVKTAYSRLVLPYLKENQ